MLRRCIALSLLFSACLLGLTACPHRNKKDKDHCPPPAEEVVAPNPMAVGETLFVPFPPDGEWHDSGILALAGDSMLIQAQGIAAGLPQGALVYRVGDNLPLDVKGSQSVEFENMGQLQFRASARGSQDIPGLLEVKVTKKDGPED